MSMDVREGKEGCLWIYLNVRPVYGGTLLSVLDLHESFCVGYRTLSVGL